MPKVEVEESELDALRQVNSFAASALKNPKTRADMLRIQKALNPDAAIPEIDAADNVMKAVNVVVEKVEALGKRLDDMSTKDTENRQQADFNSRVAKGQAFLAENGYNADGIKKIEDLMLSRGTADYEAGMALFERINPPSEPAEVSRASFFGASDTDMRQEDFKALWDSQGQGPMTDQWIENNIRKVQSEFRRN